MPFTLEELVSYGVLDDADMVGEASARASGEFALRTSLNKITTGWNELAFVTINHRDQPGLYIIGGLDDVFTQLEDDQVTLQTMMASRYISAVQAGAHKRASQPA